MKKILFTHEAFEEPSVEGAWGKIVDSDIFELDNILFYAKEYSYGDIVRVEEEGGELYVKELIKPSGHSTIRILFSDVNLIPSTRDFLKQIDCDSEQSNMDSLVAVDIPENVFYQKVRDYLDEGENKGLWEYEEACISENHQEEI
ncbi:DUF4265 domain-containing protein [Empedobacter brevis]|uniref:DUF4265 domain-containing protein n=1 Tax=Empedobacter brevis TaxID=247 RepID=A0AAJ1V7K5_9FLAO|nr:DUF4265 domain-containing protein [Empedobacter brevis]MDM1072409.1 DUF4265 domain-containing protein [Empedobacter brevis]